MNALPLCLATATTALLQGPPTGQQDSASTWILGTCDTPKAQEEYAAYAKLVIDYYQGEGQFEGPCVAEEQLSALPESNTILLGPLEIFEHADWFGPDLEKTEAGGFRLAEQEFNAPRTGIFLRSEDDNRQIYSGLSFEGWKDIFATQTGTLDCTITVDGTARFEGDWVDGQLELKARSFVPTFPSREQLGSLGDGTKHITFRDVYESGAEASLTPTFEQGLMKLAANQRVLFVGENHWNVGVNQLFNHMLRFLLVNKTPHSVFLEYNYSFSAHYNYYVGLGDDEDARLFLEDELHMLVSAPTELETLDILRRWNRDNPESFVEVGTLDMEWHALKTLAHVITPFFAALDPPYKVADIRQSGEERWLNEELPRLRERLLGELEAPNSKPFLEPAFIGQALTNLTDTLTLGTTPGTRRQDHIVRNITKFHGKRLDSGFALFKGGGFHAQKNVPAQDGLYRDAAYLHQVHPSTKGRVATIFLHGVGYGFGPFVDIDLKERIPSATNYENLITQFQADLHSGYASSADYYLLDGGSLSTLDLLAARAGFDRNQKALWLESADLPALAAAYAFNPEVQGFYDYDSQVIVLRSDLELTRPIVLESH